MDRQLDLYKTGYKTGKPGTVWFAEFAEFAELG
jgi:hypothetical protein